MDERHWWVASNIQQTFRIQGTTSPDVLEPYLTEETCLNPINDFLRKNGSNRLFVYQRYYDSPEENEEDVARNNPLVIMTDVPYLEKFTVILYFLRENNEKDVSQNRIHHEVMCGEIKQDILKNFADKLSQIYVPIFKVSKDWGKCPPERQISTLNNLEKYSLVLNDMAASSTDEIQTMILKIPEDLADMRQLKPLSQVKGQFLERQEQIVAEWISHIESFLFDADERFLTSNSGPMTEVEKWKRKQKILLNITQQLKSKQCKQVISSLVAGRSKMLRKWKLIDSGISEAINESKDKSKYLESIRSFLIQLQNNPSPDEAMKTIIPGIMRTLKMQDSLSRHYGRSGFLGLLLKKIANQLVFVGKNHLWAYTTEPEGEDLLWKNILESVTILSSNESLKKKQDQDNTKSKGAKLKMIEEEEDCFYKQLKSWLQMSAYYQNAIGFLHGSIFAEQGISRSTSHVSLPPMTHSKTHRFSLTSISDFLRTTNGISLQDEEGILCNLNIFRKRLEKVIDIIETLVEFSTLWRTSLKLPLPRKEELEIEIPFEENNLGKSDMPEICKNEEIKKVSYPIPQDCSAEGPLLPILEENIPDNGVENVPDKEAPTLSEDSDENNYILVLRKYFMDESHYPFMSSLFESFLHKMETVLKRISTTDLLHVELEEEDNFSHAFKDFCSVTNEAEMLIKSYLKVLFLRDLPVKQALDILSRFSCVSSKESLTSVINHCYLITFNSYAEELEKEFENFTHNKENPPLPRNAPKVAGTLQWCRLIMNKIKEPMDVLRHIAVVCHLEAFSRVSKMYNEAVMKIKAFEKKLVSIWERSLENVVNGLKVVLLVQNPETKQLIINLDFRLLDAIHEVKCLAKMGNPLSPSATMILSQENKLKNYKMHLEMCLGEVERIKGLVPPIWRPVFSRHFQQLTKQFHQGMTSLTWNSMNIDFFLHKVQSATKKMEDIVNSVNALIQDKLDSSIHHVETMEFLTKEDIGTAPLSHEEFKQKMLNCIQVKSKEMNNHLSKIPEIIDEILDILSTKTIHATTSSKKNQQEVARSVYFTFSENEKKKINKKILGKYKNSLFKVIKETTTKALLFLAFSLGKEEEKQSIENIQEIQQNRPIADISSIKNIGNTRFVLQSLTQLKAKEFSKLKPFIRICCTLSYNIPNIVMQPTFENISEVVMSIIYRIKDIYKDTFLNDIYNEELHKMISKDEEINDIILRIKTSLLENNETKEKYVKELKEFDFIWEKDRYNCFEEFMATNPGVKEIHVEVEKIVAIENKIAQIPSQILVGLLSINTDPLKYPLQAFAYNLKILYTSILHKDAKNLLDQVQTQRTKMHEDLKRPIENLEQLHVTLKLLQQIRDLQNKTDGVYLAIEEAYSKLRLYEVRLPRVEVKDVEQLRQRWQNLVELSEEIEKSLFAEKRIFFEQEIDRENKAFVVRVMQFRNCFDGEGPNVPNLEPEEAVIRLEGFQKEYSVKKRERSILESVAKTYGVKISTFPELDKTQEELELLSQLYGLYVRYLEFDDKFRNTLWADINFIVAIDMIESIWDDYLRLPHKLNYCYAYHDLREVIEIYQKVIPILKLLNSKEIRNRHWLQVMNICETSFPLEERVFKLHHLLDIDLDEYHTEINKICEVAQKEKEHETQLNQIEEEWTEQILFFQEYKRTGTFILDQDFTARLLEQLEDTQVTLANMLMSQYVTPMREEVATWSEKLKEVSNVLDLWLNIQNLWIHLEAVFCNESMTKDLQQELQKFATIHISWTKLMKKSYEIKNVIQTCCAGDVPLTSILHNIQKGLESCFRSLDHYLEKKRMEFPRFFFISDPILLAILSCSQSLELVKPYLRSLFSHISHIETEYFEKRIDKEEKEGKLDSPSCELETISEETVPEVSTKDEIQNSELPLTEKKLQIISIKSFDGEKIDLNKKVFVEDNVEEWMKELKNAINENIHEMSLKAIDDIENNLPWEELIQKYPTQVCHLSTLHYWSMEIESGIQKLKNDRKALSIVYKKFHCLSNKIFSSFNKNFLKAEKEFKSTTQHLRLESLAIQANYLRDLLECICQRRIKECSDFEWRRTLKCFVFPDTSNVTKAHLVILDNETPYGGEFCGTCPKIIITPSTDKCFLFLSQAMHSFHGVSLIGPCEVGKKETLIGLANTVAQYYRIVQCFEGLEPSCLARIIQGCSLEECWTCFFDGNKLSSTCLAVLLDHVDEIFNILKVMTIRSKENMENQLSCLNPPVAFFMTVTVEPNSNWHFPQKVKSVFRTVSLIKPDTFFILKGTFVSVGFKGANFLSGRLIEIASLAKKNLPATYSSHFNLTSLISVVKRASQIQAFRDEKSSEKSDALLRPESQVSTSTSKASLGSTSRQSQISSGARKSSSASHVKKTDLKILLQAIEETLSIGMDIDSSSRFQMLVNAAICGKASDIAHKENPKTTNLEKSINRKMIQMNLNTSKDFIEKCIHINTANNIYNGLLIVGPPGSGKSTCLQVLSQVLNEMNDKRNCASEYSSQKSFKCGLKLIRINPLTVDDFELMFSGFNSNEQLLDGFFTSVLKKANRNSSKTWIVLDAPVNPSWMDYLASALHKNRIIHLKNGDIICINDNVTLFFETDNIQSASPTTLSKLGVVYVEGIVGWEILAKTWIKTRKMKRNPINGIPNDMEEEILMQCFQTTIDNVMNFLKTKTKSLAFMTETGMFTSCLQILTALLSDKMEMAGNTHIKKLFLFCLVWSFGSHLDEDDRKAFSNFLFESRTNVFSDEDEDEEEGDMNLYDYFVDESGEWENWNTKPTECLTDFSLNFSFNGEFIYTNRTIPLKYFMELLVPNGFPVLLCGPHGSGKTALIKDIMNILGQQEFVCKRLVYSRYTTSKQLLDLIEANINHRQGFVYGATDKKNLGIFIEDLNLPKSDEFQVQKCNELLRQLIAEKVIYNLKSPFEMKCIEGLSVMAEVSTSRFDLKDFNPRLLRHFAVFNLSPPHKDDLFSILSKKLEVHLNVEDQLTINGDIVDGIVDASCCFLLGIQSILNRSPLPGRQHYIFTLQDMQNCFQMFRLLTPAQRTDEHFVLSLWRHEVQRVFFDSVARTSDLNSLENLLNSILTEKWPDFDTKEKQHLVTIPPKKNEISSNCSLELEAIKTFSVLHDYLQGFLIKHNAMKGFNNLDIILSEYAISHIIRIQRILYHPRGHLLTISSLGSGIEKLCILACEVSNVRIVEIEENIQPLNFIDSLKDVVRQAGTTAHPTAIILNTKNLQNPTHLDWINSFLITEDYTSIFSPEELSTILQAIIPESKKDSQEKKIEPAEVFSYQVNLNLHILINLSPRDELLSSAASAYPNILKVCQINWMCDWMKNNLISTATCFLEKSNFVGETSLRDELSSCLADIHHLMLEEYKSAPWAGKSSSTICLNTGENLEEKKENMKITKETLTNLPYTQNILLEHIQNRQDDSKTLRKRSYMTLSMQDFKQLLHCFEFLFCTKRQQKEEEIVKIKKCLSKLEETRKVLFEMKETVKDLTWEYEEAKNKAETLLVLITEKATKLETLKAQIGMNPSIQAILEMNEIKINFDKYFTEDDPLLAIDDYDEYDQEFDQILQEEMIQNKKKTKDDLISAKTIYSLKKKSVQKSKEQVYFWLQKIDRNCIESIRGFSKPPHLVLEILEILMILTGRQTPLSSLSMSAVDRSSDRATTASSGDSVMSQKTPNKTKPGLSWKLMQQILGESKSFTDILRNLPLEEGLSQSMIKTLSTFISRKEIERSRNEIESETQDITDIKGDHALEEGITIAAAKHASEDVAIVLQYMLALLVYSTFFQELKELKENIKVLQEQIEESEKQTQENVNIEPSIPLPAETEEELDEADIPVFEEELDVLQEEYNFAAERKATLKENLQSKNEKLLATSQLLTSLKQKESEWRSYVQEESNEVLLTNILLASAFLTYCGPFGIHQRENLCNSFIQICKKHQFPEPNQKLFCNLSLHQYIFPPMLEMDLEIRQMPMTRVFLENCCFFTEEKIRTKWPLICDPNHQAIGWYRNYLQGTHFVEVHLHELKSQLDNCLTEGISLFVTECHPWNLVNNQRLCCIIKASQRFLESKESFKINVGDYEVECKPSFRLYLHTSSEAHEVGDFLSAFTSRITFPQSIDCLTQQLLLRCLNQEKNRIKGERSHLLQTKQKQTQLLQSAETDLIKGFCEDIFSLNEISSLKNLLELVKKYEDLQESLKTIDDDLKSVLQQTKDQYLIIAKRGALCYNLMQNMKELNPLYQFPYPRFLRLFDSIVSHSDRSMAKSIAEKLVFTCNQKIVCRLQSRDRIVFTLLLALEIEFNEGRIKEREKEFLLSPSRVSQTLPSLPSASYLLNQTGLEWMPNDVFTNLQTLAMSFDWFTDIFANMNKDNKDTSWKSLYESEAPEICNLPDKLTKNLTALQRFCVLRALRSDRMLQLATAFISTVLGNKFLSDYLLNVPLITDSTNPTTPILMIAFDPSINTELYFSTCCKGKKTFIQTISLNISLFSTSSEETKIKEFIWQKMTEGVWLLLNNAHSWPPLLENIISWLKEKKIVNPVFRCWLSIDPKSCQIPSHLLNNSMRIVIDSPIQVKFNMIQSFSHMDPEILKRSSNPLWPAMIHNICFLHATLRLHASLKNTWLCPEDISKNDLTELLEATEFAASEFDNSVTFTASDGSKKNRLISYSAIRNILSEAVFGRYQQHPVDRFCLASIVEQLISLSAVKKDVEQIKAKYKIPATFFQNNVKLAALIHSLNSLPNQVLDSTETCYLYKINAETNLEPNYILDCLHKIWKVIQPTSMFLSQTSHSEGEKQIFPQSRNIESAVPDSSDFLSKNVLSSKFIWEICVDSLSKLPRILSKENLQLRMNKIGGATVYNRFIFGEISQLNNLVLEIKSTLQVLKGIFEEANFGMNLPENLIAVCESICLEKIPQIWTERLGATSLVAPGTSFTNWLQDLHNRSTYLERITLMGREKMPTYWLGAFLQPQQFLSLFKWEFMTKMAAENMTYERISMQTVITARDKDHIRDPPAEGVFLYGIYTWGFSWDKSTGEVLDSLPKGGGAGSLPVVHLFYTHKPKEGDVYSCPVYSSRESIKKESIFDLDVYKESITPSKWSLHRIMATLHPF